MTKREVPDPLAVEDLISKLNNAESFLKLSYIQSKEIGNKKYYEENKLKRT